MATKDSDGISLDKNRGPAEPDAATPPRPKQISWIVLALALCGLGAVGASASLYGLHHFLVHQLEAANRKAKGTSAHKSHADVLHTASIQPGISMIESALFLVVVLFVARSVWRGRYWARWAVIGLWILATFTGIYGGLLQITAVFADAPIALKIPIFLSSVTFVVAVALIVFVKPVVAWLNLTRPERKAATPAPARRSMFTSRDPVRAAQQGLSTVSPVGSRKVRETAARTEDLFRGDANTERARAKQRMNTETMHRNAAEARARARGSKSRRSGS